MAQSAKNAPTMERTTGGRTFRASLLDDLTWAVVITGGNAERNAEMARDFADVLDAETAADVRSGRFGPWVGNPRAALFTTAAGRLGWDVVRNPPEPDGKLEPGVVY